MCRLVRIAQRICRPLRAPPTPAFLSRTHAASKGSILPGVTRASVIELARSRGYDVQERPVSVTEAMEVGQKDGIRDESCLLTATLIRAHALRARIPLRGMRSSCIHCSPHDCALGRPQLLDHRLMRCSRRARQWWCRRSAA
jgi:hypothetical protein